MQGDSEVIARLNALLSRDLTAFDQYFVQARMFEHWGYRELRERLEHEAAEEHGHADRIIKRILLLDGQPDVAARAPLNIGRNPKEMLANDRDLELEVARFLNDAIAVCREKGDNGSRALLEHLLHETEQDLLWFEQQVELIETLGVENYLAEKL